MMSLFFLNREFVNLMDSPSKTQPLWDYFPPSHHLLLTSRTASRLISCFQSCLPSQWALHTAEQSLEKVNQIINPPPITPCASILCIVASPVLVFLPDVISYHSASHTLLSGLPTLRRTDSCLTPHVFAFPEDSQSLFCDFQCPLLRVSLLCCPACPSWLHPPSHVTLHCLALLILHHRMYTYLTLTFIVIHGLMSWLIVCLPH